MTLTYDAKKALGVKSEWPGETPPGSRMPRPPCRLLAGSRAAGTGQIRFRPGP